MPAMEKKKTHRSEEEKKIIESKKDKTHTNEEV